jgi:hypothetical protein
LLLWVKQVCFLIFFKSLGDSQVAVMDLTNHVIYVMYPQYGTWDYGYNRPIVKIDLKPFFGE